MTGLKTYFLPRQPFLSNTANWLTGTVSLNVDFHYAPNGFVGSIVEQVSGSTIITELDYVNVTGVGSLLGSVIESRDGLTITTIFNYSGSGELLGFNRSVV